MDSDFNTSTMSTNTINRYMDVDVGDRVKHSSAFDYNGKLHYEGGAISENRKLFGLLHRAFGEFKIEAMNGFKKLSKRDQKNVVQERRNQVLNALGNGSFFLKDMYHYQEKVTKRVDRIYTPNMKWSRKAKASISVNFPTQSL